MYTRRSGFISSNAAISRAVCAVRLHDKMGGTTIHANGQRVQRRSAWLCYACILSEQVKSLQATTILDSDTNAIS